MQNRTSKAILSALTLAATLLSHGPVQAHHSITGEFDTSVTFALRGTLTALDWANPHLWYYLDVVNEAGEVEQWQCTTGQNPNRLIRAGWRKEDLPIGSVVRIERANPAHDKSNTCIIGGIAFDDGTPVFSGVKGAAQ